jgi:hypothetical protein
VPHVWHLGTRIKTSPKALVACIHRRQVDVLLLGRPPYLRRHEWDTSELDSVDFERYHAPYSETLVSNSYTALRDMARLAGVADSIQESRWYVSAATSYAKIFTPLALFQFSSCMLEAY